MGETARRSLVRPQQRGLTRGFLQTVRDVQRLTPAGIILPPVGAFYPDMTRIQRVVGRIVKGLYFHETASIVPPEHRIRVTALPFSCANGGPSSDVATKLVEAAEAVIANTTARIIGGGVFRYWVHYQQGGSIWCLVFYEAAGFLALTIPPGGTLAARPLPERPAPAADTTNGEVAAIRPRRKPA